MYLLCPVMKSNNGSIHISTVWIIIIIISQKHHGTDRYLINYTTKSVGG
jgi:hypothetical protein